MSTQNPSAALAALLPRPIAIEGTGEAVRPFTLATYCLLDEIGSPLLRDGGPESARPLALLPSLFVACRGAAEALDAPNLLRAALAWADTLPPTALPAICAATTRQIAAFLSVMPTPKKETGTPDTTAGLSPSPTLPPTPTAGASTKSCTASPPAP